jgi:molybdate/tungstate transport system substrate-binding protein
MKEINVYSAGVALGLTSQAVERWNELHPDSPAKMTAGGSVAGVRRHLAGELFDLLILADDRNIADLMIPRTASGYVVFAGNKMVIAAVQGHSIDSTNWVKKLLDPTAVFLHFNPQVDPGGYRAVMAMLLADRYQAGLSAKLLNHPGRYCPEEKPPPLKPGEKPPYAYQFLYYSLAKSRGLAFAELPTVMDLSSEDLADVYASVEFALDESTVVRGSPINHALTVPLNAPNPQGGRELARLFLTSDFAAHNFLPRSKIVGGGLESAAG